MESGSDSKYISYFDRMFDKVDCLVCNNRMKRIDWPYEPGWKCPVCGWITWFARKEKLAYIP